MKSVSQFIEKSNQKEKSHATRKFCIVERKDLMEVGCIAALEKKYARI